MTAADSMLMQPLAALVDETGVENWRGLTSMPLKRDLYAKETYFRESWCDAVHCLGDQTTARLQQLALLVLKPDAFFGRRARSAVAYFRERDFVPVAWTEFRYTRWSMREDWRYQLNQLSTDRLALNERLLTCADSTLILFRDATEEPELPAAVRMQALKGNSLPEHHQPHQLRSVLRSTNRLFKFAHTADEPADVVRELGVLFERPLRRELYREACAANGDLTHRLVDHLQRKSESFPAHALDLRRSVALLQATAKNGSARARELAAFIARLADHGLPQGQWLCLDAFEARLAEAEIELPLLDTLVIATHFIYHSFPLEFAVMRGDGHAGWRSGEGRMFRADACPSLPPRLLRRMS